MKYYINGKKVTKKVAKDFVEKLWGSGKFEERVQEAKEYFMEESDDVCSWADGFAIKY